MNVSVLTHAIHQAMQFLFHVTGNYGWAILLLTLAVRLGLTPFYIWQQRASRGSAALQEQAKAIQEKYQGEEQQTKLKELYSRYGGAMLAGCLPALLQWPVLIAMYGALNSFPYVLPAGFFWLENLAAPDPFFVLPVLAVATSVWQIWAGSPRQQRLTMLVVPVLMGLFLIKTSAAVMLYWVAGNVVSLLQQYLFARRPAVAAG